MSLGRFIAFTCLVYVAIQWLRRFMTSLERAARDIRAEQARFEAQQRQRGGWPGAGWAPPRAAPPPRPEPSAYEVLGVTPQAGSTEIRAAYQALVRQYHPDHVAHLGPELREVAERRTKEITAAYNALKNRQR